MAGTVVGAKKAAETIKRAYGQEFFRHIGQKGGLAGHTGGFYGNPEKAREAGRKGGYMSKRGPAKANREEYAAYYKEKYGKEWDWR